MLHLACLCFVTLQFCLHSHTEGWRGQALATLEVVSLPERRSRTTALYDAVTRSGLGVVQCLGHEVFGRWCSQGVNLLPLLAREKSRGMHPRLRRGVALGYQQRWAGIVSVGLMKAVAAAAVRSEGCDLATSLLEPEPAVSDLMTF